MTTLNRSSPVYLTISFYTRTHNKIRSGPHSATAYTKHSAVMLYLIFESAAESSNDVVLCALRKVLHGGPLPVESGPVSQAQCGPSMGTTKLGAVREKRRRERPIDIKTDK